MGLQSALCCTAKHTLHLGRRNKQQSPAHAAGKPCWKKCESAMTSPATALETGSPESGSAPASCPPRPPCASAPKTAACHGRQRVQPRAGAATAQRQQPILLTWKGVFLRWTLNENESLPMITRPQARAAHARPPARQVGGTAASSGSRLFSKLRDSACLPLALRCKTSSQVANVPCASGSREAS